jgi:hypothetical protein
MTAEKIASGIIVAGLALVVVVIAGFMAWYFGPLGPITHPPLWLRWLVTMCLFLFIGTMLALGAVMFLTCWLFDVRVWLEEKIHQIKQRRAVRRQQVA